jgi:hypothetical protein
MSTTQRTIDDDEEQSTTTVKTFNVSPVSERAPLIVEAAELGVHLTVPTYKPSPKPVTSQVQHLIHTRIIRPPERYRLDVVFIAQAWDDMWDMKDHELQETMTDPITLAASTNSDTMYLHEALRAPDRAEFIRAMMQDEVKAHADIKQASTSSTFLHVSFIDHGLVPHSLTMNEGVWDFTMSPSRSSMTSHLFKQ